MTYKAVIFDLDGTLLDTIDDLANSMNTVLDAHGYPVHSLAQYKLFVGNGLRNLTCRALPEEFRDDAAVDRSLAEMKKEYGKRWAEKTHPYEGVPELLSSLMRWGIKFAVLSNKADEFTKEIIKTLLPDWTFKAVIGERPGVPRKPDPAGAFEIARIMELEPESIVYLGDSGTDMDTATAAGMLPVGALWGFRSREELEAHGAKILLSKPSELLKIF